MGKGGAAFAVETEAARHRVVWSRPLLPQPGDDGR